MTTVTYTPCQQDPELFFAESKRGQIDPKKAAKAKTLCRTRCPISAECLAQALATQEPYGIWGGMTSAERRNIGRPQRAIRTDDGRDESVIQRLMDGAVIPDANRVDIAHALVRLWQADQGSVRGLARRLGVSEHAARGWVQRAVARAAPHRPRMAGAEPGTSGPHPGGGVMELNRRALAMLRAVADGRAEATCSCEPDLYVDGLCVCDQFTAHELAHGLIRPIGMAVIGKRVKAELTEAGIAALAVA